MCIGCLCSSVLCCYEKGISGFVADSRGRPWWFIVLEVVTVNIASSCDPKPYRKLPKLHVEFSMFPCQSAALVQMIGLHVLGGFARFRLMSLQHGGNDDGARRTKRNPCPYHFDGNELCPRYSLGCQWFAV